jgi:hypothetical protein
VELAETACWCAGVIFQVSGVVETDVIGLAEYLRPVLLNYICKMIVPRIVICQQNAAIEILPASSFKFRYAAFHACYATPGNLPSFNLKRRSGERLLNVLCS